MRFFGLTIVMALLGSSVGMCQSADVTPQTKALYGNLLKLADRGVMFGHQDATLYGVNWKYESGRSDVRDVCGDYPALYGWEIGNLELGDSTSLDLVPFDVLRKNIVAAHKRGGVNTISWHANNPETGGNSWDKETKTAVASLVEGGSNHTKYKQWLDIVADFILSLRDDNGKPIPILFRPWHENHGSWFWWGASQCTPQEYLALWHFTADYLRKVKKIDNLLYVYSPNDTKSKAEYLSRYPGDEYVDVLGLDAYDYKGMNYPKHVTELLKVVNEVATEKGKPVCFSETGSEGLPNSKWWTESLMPVLKGVKLSYVMVWRNAHDKPGHYFGPHPEGASADDFRKFAKDPHIIMESDLPKMYK